MFHISSLLLVQPLNCVWFLKVQSISLNRLHLCKHSTCITIVTLLLWFYENALIYGKVKKNRTFKFIYKQNINKNAESNTILEHFTSTMNCTGFDFDFKKSFSLLAKRLINRHTLFIPFPILVHGGVTIPLKIRFLCTTLLYS